MIYSKAEVQNPVQLRTKCLDRNQLIFFYQTRKSFLGIPKNSVAVKANTKIMKSSGVVLRLYYNVYPLSVLYNSIEKLPLVFLACCHWIRLTCQVFFQFYMYTVHHHLSFYLGHYRLNTYDYQAKTPLTQCRKLLYISEDLRCRPFSTALVYQPSKKWTYRFHYIQSIYL